MKIPLNNYCKYISGIFFAISGYFLLIFMLVSPPTTPDETFFNTYLTLTVSLSISYLILITGIIEFFIRYLYSRIRRYSAQSSIKTTKVIIIYRILFWIGILLTQLPFPYKIPIPPIIVVIIDVFKTLFSNISYIIQNHF